MGYPKQLIEFNGETLLSQSTRKAVESGANPVLIVLGANAALCSPEIEGFGAQIVLNEEWKEGIASSIRAGIRSLPADTGSVLILLADQPLVATELLVRMRASPGEIIACSYGSAVGPPVIFSRKFFDELAILEGDSGAKKLLSKYAAQVFTIPFPGGSLDIDTPGDLALLSLENRPRGSFSLDDTSEIPFPLEK
jgi:molybdenum cofactor cytidylyltransferase